jgi:hypothetical protein
LSQLANNCASKVVFTIAPALIPVRNQGILNPLKTVWTRIAIADELLFQGTLVFAAAHLDLMMERDPSRETLYYEGEIVRGVNSRLNYLEAASDSTIGAVALLAGAESLRGNIQELNIHMNAVKIMVELSGGLEQLGLSGLLHMIITW